MDVIREQFISIVEDRLKELGWTRSQLAREMGVSRQHVTDHLNSHVNSSTETLEKFLDALGLEPRLTVRKKTLEKAS